MPRRNLVTNPSFRAGTANYAPTNGATLSITTEYSFYGSDALIVVKSSDNNSGVVSTSAISVVAGLPYAASVYVRLPKTLAPSEAANLALTIQWADSFSVAISSDSSGIYNLEDDTTWVRLSGVWTAPVGATVAYIGVSQISGGTAGQSFIVDAFLVEQSNYVGGYVDNLGQAEENRIVNKALTSPPPVVFNGLELNGDVILNELVLNTIDEEGVIWICTGIEGWWGQSAPDSPDIPRGTEDGSYDVTGRYQARIVTLKGVFIPPSREALGAARDRLVTASNLVRRGGWLRTNESPTRAAFVRLSGAPQMDTINARGRTEFSVGLKAADPIKYEWADSDPEGYTIFRLDAADASGVLENVGTADVTGLITLTGPLGAGSRVYNSLTGETTSLSMPLRGAGVAGTVVETSVTAGVATIRTEDDHKLSAGDVVSVSGVGAAYDSLSGPVTVLAASNVFPYTFSFATASDDLDRVPAVGFVHLAYNDVLVIDTYNRSVSFNGQATGHRVRLKTLTDWIKFAPGDNILEFVDDIDHLVVVSKSISGGQATLGTEGLHYLTAGEEVTVALAEEAQLSKKSLTGNVATLVTNAPHGFSVGDSIDVDSVEQSAIDNKEATGTEATLKTVDEHGISVTDTVIVALPASATPVKKSLTSNLATITTAVAHGFSAGDSVVVDLLASVAISAKSVASNQVTLTTPVSHGYQIGDSITVALGVNASVIKKERIGTFAVLTTSAPHTFSTGDTVVVSLPTSATPTDSRSIDEYVVTLNTAAAHNFSVGDVIIVDIGVSSSASVTTRSATATACTLTLGSHGFSVGETITVSGVDDRYNGTFVITAKTGTTVTYDNNGATESSVASGGSVLNVTINSGYNGNKVINSVPTTTSLTYYAWEQYDSISSSSPGTGASITNTTNTAFNGSKVLSDATGSSLKYSYGGP